MVLLTGLYARSVCNGSLQSNPTSQLVKILDKVELVASYLYYSQSGGEGGSVMLDTFHNSVTHVCGFYSFINTLEIKYYPAGL